jgi:chromosomal replication initiator protein
MQRSQPPDTEQTAALAGPADSIPPPERPTGSVSVAPEVPGLGTACTPAAALDVHWHAIRRALLARINPDQFETWFRRANLRSITGGAVCVGVQNSFARDWLHSNYLSQLREAVAEVTGCAPEVRIEVDAELASAPRAGSSAAPVAAASEPSAASGKPARGELALVYSDSVLSPRSLLGPSDFSLNNHYRFENFVVGPCNRFAHAAAVGVSESPGRAYNPFFLHGGVGLGKTHLLQSLCSALLDRYAGTRILYLSCETFVNHFISALENGDLSAFRNKYRNVDVLVVDDIHMLANKERTQEEFFNTFNTLYNAGKQIVLSSDSSPKEIPALQDRLVSRFKWGLVTEIETPCYETRVAIVRRKSRQRGRELPEDVACLIAEHVDSNIRELEGAVTRVLGFATLNNLEVSVELARRVLMDAIAARKAAPSMDDVLKIVTAHFNVRVADLQSRRRTNAIAHPRQIGMYLARRITRHSLEEIGRFFGGRDHSTVLYAIEKVEETMKRDERFRAQVATFLDRLGRSS